MDAAPKIFKYDNIFKTDKRGTNMDQFNVKRADFAEMGGRSTYIPADKVQLILQQLQPLNRLRCEFSLQTGFRIDDVLSMQTADLIRAVDNNYWLLLHEKKTGKSRSVRVTKDTVRRLMAVAGAVFVFECRDDVYKHRCRQTVYRDFKQAAQNVLGRGATASVHSLRKNYAVDLYARTNDLLRVQRDLNHNNISTTVLYALADKL